MGTARFSDDFKRDAVAQITERGYSDFLLKASSIAIRPS